jgi:hypothetical protein
MGAPEDVDRDIAPVPARRKANLIVVARRAVVRTAAGIGIETRVEVFVVAAVEAVAIGNRSRQHFCEVERG